MGWCNGTPGIARALWLAGEALDAPSYRDAAVAAMESVLRLPAAGVDPRSPSICHGLSGVLQIALRFARDTGKPAFTQGVVAVTERLLALYDPGARFGYVNPEPVGLKDDPGLLCGASGAALALLAASEEEDPAWDQLFLLS
jgi:lantibiotic biosynthesis protein